MCNSNCNDNKLFNLVEEIKALFREAERKNLSPNEFAIRIWLGTILQSRPETTLVSVLFEKAINVSPEETYQMIDDLIYQSKLQKVDAIKRAISLIVEGLKILNNESIIRQFSEKN